MARSNPSRAKGMFVSALKWALAIGFLGLVGLGVAVAVAMSQLPDYQQLSRRSDLGQMVRVRAADGTLLVSLGPSFGRWLNYDEIPPTMRSAMIAVEDKRFRSHVGVDPIGVARSFKVRIQSGSWKQGRIDHHPAAGAQHLPDQQPDVRPQGQGGGAGAGPGAEIHQGPDPRALSQPRLFRRWRLWHRRRQPDLLRPWRRAAEPGRSGDHRRTGQGAVQLFAHRRCRGGTWSRRRGAEFNGREWLPASLGRCRSRSCRNQGPAGGQAEQRSIFHRLGPAAARHADRRNQRSDRRLDHA